MLLTKTEEWTPKLPLQVLTIPNTITNLSSISSASTVTVNNVDDDDSSIGNDIPVIIAENQENEDDIMTTSVNYNVVWKSLLIPWSRLSEPTIKELEKGTRITTKVVHLVVEEMRKVKEQIPQSAFKIMAQKIISAYPDSLIDRDEDKVVFGSGEYGLISKLID